MNRSRVKKVEATSNEMRTFLMAYKTNSCLWDVGNAGYSKQTTRLEALQDIAMSFDMTVEQVKKKIHAVRSTYNQLRLKVLETENTDKPYKPILSWYNDASFLDSVITPRKHRDTIDRRAGSAFGRGMILDTINIVEIESEDTRKRDLEDGSDLEEMGCSPSRKKMLKDKESEELSTTTKIRLKMKPESRDILSTVIDDGDPNFVTVPEYIEPEAEENVEIINDYTTENASAANPEKDEFAFFSEFLSSQLRILPKSMSVELMCKIHVLISEARIKSMAGKK